MAAGKQTIRKPKASPEAQPAGSRFVISVLVMSLVAAGLGAGGGLLMFSNLEDMVIAKYKAEREAAVPPTGRYSGNIHIRSVQPIVTNLANTRDDWVRLESSIIFSGETDRNPDIMLAETRQDLLGYLRTVSLAQIQGPSGLMHLREDLNERVRMRSNGAIQELIIESLVVQ